MATKLRMQVKVAPDAGFQRTVDRLKAAGRGDLQKAMVAALRRRAQPARAAVQASIRQADFPAIPSRGGGKSSGLRDRVAGAVRIKQTPTGLELGIDGNRVDPTAGTSLVLGLNGLTKIRHPTFGRRGKGQWINQRGSKERFYSALEPHRAGWEKDCEGVLDRYAKQIGG